MTLQKILTRLVIPAAVTFFGILCAVGMIFMKPSADRAPAHAVAPLVEVVDLTPSDSVAKVVAQGLVIPAQQVGITAEVGGRITSVADDFRRGRRFEEGEVMARIDARDYKLAVEAERARVMQSELELELERGRQQIAEREWELLADGRSADDAPLALRKPQLLLAEQSLQASRGSLERAELALSRTVLRAPFNAIVAEEQIDVGQVVGPGAPVITLIGTDQYWIEVSVAVEKLAVLDVPGVNAQQGSLATVTHVMGDGASVVRDGTIVGLAGQLDPQTRMAQLLIAVDDPLDTNGGRIPLFAGAYVDVSISGRVLADTYAVPRVAVVEGDDVWLVIDGGLAKRTVQIGWREDDVVYVTGGLNPGETLVVTPLSLPLEGMAVRTDGDATAASNGE